MKKLHIDYKKHMGYSKSAGRGIKARLREKYSPSACDHLMEKIDRKYEEFLSDLPYCGGKHNMMIWQLYDAIAAFAYYDVLPEKETLEEFTKTCAVIFEKDKQRKVLPHFLTVDSKVFIRVVRALIRPIAKKMNRELDCGNWQDAWRIEMESDHLEEGLQVALIGCPIYYFAIKHGYEKLMSAMCNCDFPGIDFLHARLIRPRTVSNGDDRCDNWIVSADSDDASKFPPVLRENGLLISRDWREEKASMTPNKVGW